MITFRCGRIAVVGRPNAGKSTLVNRLVGEKVAIVSPVPQTTRAVVLGVRHEPDAQFVFLDTPGIHLAKRALNRRMVEEAVGALEGVDVVVQVVDAAGDPGRGDDFVAERARGAGVPLVVVLNKVDRVSPRSDLLALMARFGEGAAAVVPASALHGEGVEALLEELRKLLPEGDAEHGPDVVTDQGERFLIAELIREKVLLATRMEVPHATGVLVDSVEDKEREDGRHVLVVHATLLVEKENQKAIVIGRGGDMLKRVGTAARLDIEQHLGVTCHLSLFVKVAPHWREDEKILARMFEHAHVHLPMDTAALERELGAGSTEDE